MKQKGFSPIIIVILLALFALGAGAYFLYVNRGMYGGINPFGQNLTPPAEMSEEVSDASDSDTLGSELDETQLDSTDSDFSELDSSASQL